MAGHGQPWPARAATGQPWPWLAVPGYGRPKLAMGGGGGWPARGGRNYDFLQLKDSRVERFKNNDKPPSSQCVAEAWLYRQRPILIHCSMSFIFPPTPGRLTTAVRLSPRIVATFPFRITFPFVVRSTTRTPVCLSGLNYWHLQPSFFNFLR